MTRRMHPAVLTGAVALAAALALWPRPSRADEAPPAAASAAAQAPVTWYTCGMHPEVIQDHPGTCPKCGMVLVPMDPDRAAALGLAGAAEEAAAPRAAAGTIRVDPTVRQNIGIRTEVATRGPLQRSVRAVGYVEYDETSLAVVTTKVDGWIETLHVDQTGRQVHAGEPLFTLYAPALYSAQREYLAARRGRRRDGAPGLAGVADEGDDLVRAARTRLEFFDVSPEEIAALERAGRERKTLTIRARSTGVVIDKAVVAGQRVAAGEPLLRLADLSTVWVMAKVYEQDAPYVAAGQEAFMTLSYLPGRTFHGRVTYVYPFLERGTRELSVRMEFHNPGYELKPGMYATVTMSAAVAADAVLVPDMAVIETGRRSVAFVERDPGHFEPRQVVVGTRDDAGRVQVLSGIAPGEQVVVAGQFLLDSESRLREAALKLLAPGAVGAATPVRDVTAAATGTPAGDARLYHVCPMPGHEDILYDDPGTCPLCGMALVPVRRLAGHVDRPVIDHWTCPMPGHEQVHEGGPGKCPICGMTLVPVTRQP